MERSLHRLALFSLHGLDAEGVLVASVGMGQYGLKIDGAVADIRAVLNNVLWEDEHCMECCGMLFRWMETEPGVLLRCAPTISIHADVAVVTVEKVEQ